MHYFPVLRTLGPLPILLRFLTACICGAVIGYSRGRQQRPAGFRTHVLVCLGAASTVVMSQFSVEVLNVPGDVLRIPAQVISGIGFLGAGTIIMQKHVIHGLTTAAGMWVAAGIGMAAAAGLYWVAVAATGLCLVGLELFGRLNRSIRKHSEKEPENAG